MANKRRELVDHREAMVQESRQTRAGMMSAMGALEAALARPSPGREKRWEALVRQEVAALEATMSRQLDELDGEDNTLAAIGRDEPRLYPRIQQLRRQYRDLLQQVSALREQLSAEGAPQALEVRQRLAWLLTALKHFQATETDLMYEAMHVDIGAAD